jgi:hypothetical protein
MQLAPDPALVLAVDADLPLALAVDLEPGGVDGEMQRATGGGSGAVLASGESLPQASSVTFAGGPTVAFGSRSEGQTQTPTFRGQHQQAVDEALALLVDVRQRWHERREATDAPLRTALQEIYNDTPAGNDAAFSLLRERLNVLGQLGRSTRT